MRITADHPKSDTAMILLNGVDVSTICLEADSKEGWVKLALIGLDGRPLPDENGNVVTLVAYGRVVVGFRKLYRCHHSGRVLADAASFATWLATPKFSES